MNRFQHHREVLHKKCVDRELIVFSELNEFNRTHHDTYFLPRHSMATHQICNSSRSAFDEHLKELPESEVEHRWEGL